MALTERCLRRVITIQVSIVDAAEISFEQQAIRFLCFGCLNPIGRTPRRPKFLSFEDNEPTEEIILHCRQIGIIANTERPAQDTSLSHQDVLLNPDLRQCTTCSTFIISNSLKSCSRCQGVVYCSNKCLQKNWEESHKLWCDVFKDSMDMENALADLPFPFVNVTTSRTFSRNAKMNFLQHYGVFGIGLWARECPDSLMNLNDKRIVLEDKDNIYGLLMESSLLSQALPDVQLPLANWSDYYRLRGLPATSIICVLLNFSMTLYHIITSCLPSDFKDAYLSLQQEKSVIVHIIGAEREAEMFQPFLECARILRPLHIQIHLFGNEMPKLNGKTTRAKENLDFHLHYGLYHEIDHNHIPKPHIAVCFNGGLGAYSSYMPTVQLLTQKSVPFYYTDYGQECIAFSNSALEKCKVGIISEPKLNPFRSPLRMVSSDQNLPRYSNAFISYIKPYSQDSTNASF